jgi:hypothetical protein
MKVWLVGISDGESSNVEHVCVSKTTAEKFWEDIRQDLIRNAKEMLEYERKNKCESGVQIQERILKNLSEVNPELMNNYPQEEPFVREMETE